MSTSIPGPYNSPYVIYHSGSDTFPERDPFYIADSGSLATLGANTFVGTQTFTGNLVPTVSSSFSLGTVNNPWKEIFISSGSLSIQSDTPGDPAAVISNKSGNLEISVGGMQLLGNASFRSATGSFSYISGSMSQVGDYTQIGNKTVNGSLRVSGSLYMNGNKQFNYGQWASLQTQSGSANTAYAMKLDYVTDGLSGTYVSNNESGYPTRIYVQNNGLYNIQFSAQLHTTVNQACDFSIWFAMTGSAIPASNTDFSIEKVAGGGFQVAALNFLTPITSGSYVELFWSKTTANGQLQYKGIQSAPARPSTPSVIVTVTQIA